MNEEYYPYHNGQEDSQSSRLEPVQQPQEDTTYRYKRVDNGAIPKEPMKKEKKTGSGGGWLKRAAAFLLAGVLFGGAAGGAFVGVTYISQKNGIIASAETETEPQTAAEQKETQEAAAAATNAYQSNGSASGTLDVSGVVEQVMPSVVAITNTQIYENMDQYFDYFQYFFGGGYNNRRSDAEEEPQEYTAGSGSGIIIGENDTEYLIVTNYHVIEGANSLTITFADDSTAKANVKGSDSEADVAVVAVAKSDLTSETMGAIRVATMGNSDNLKTGQGVIAIGNALGFGQSVTVGYISALNRQVTTSDNITRTLLQTDAAINPGNSGGALVNMDGQLIGINSAKYSDTDVEGIGYAIPISTVQDLIDELMDRKTRIEVPEEEQGYLGITGATVDSTTSSNLGMPQGVYVYSVLENGACAGTGLTAKDIITKLDGERVETMDELQELLSTYYKGDTVTLTIERLTEGEYTEQEIQVTLGDKVSE